MRRRKRLNEFIDFLSSDIFADGFADDLPTKLNQRFKSWFKQFDKIDILEDKLKRSHYIKRINRPMTPKQAEALRKIAREKLLEMEKRFS